MARRKENSIRDALTSLISPQLIRRRAPKLSAVKRARKVDIVALVYTLVLGFDTPHRPGLLFELSSTARTAGIRSDLRRGSGRVESGT